MVPSGHISLFSEIFQGLNIWVKLKQISAKLQCISGIIYLISFTLLILFPAFSSESTVLTVEPCSNCGRKFNPDSLVSYIL